MDIEQSSLVFQQDGNTMTEKVTERGIDSERPTHFRRSQGDNTWMSKLILKLQQLEWGSRGEAPVKAHRLEEHNGVQKMDFKKWIVFGNETNMIEWGKGTFKKRC